MKTNDKKIRIGDLIAQKLDNVGNELQTLITFV